MPHKRVYMVSPRVKYPRKMKARARPHEIKRKEHYDFAADIDHHTHTSLSCCASMEFEFKGNSRGSYSRACACSQRFGLELPKCALPKTWNARAPRTVSRASTSLRHTRRRSESKYFLMQPIYNVSPTPPHIATQRELLSYWFLLGAQLALKTYITLRASLQRRARHIAKRASCGVANTRTHTHT